MNSEPTSPPLLSPTRLALLGFGFMCFLHGAWIAAWLLEQWLEGQVDWLATSGQRTLYWNGMKLALWIAPATLLIWVSGRSVREVMGLGRVRAILLWGGGVGVLIGLTAFIPKTMNGQPLFSAELGWPLLSGVVLAPIIEEYTFRGALLGALTPRLRFPLANVITAFFFTTIHFPGWYFQDRLYANLTLPIGGAFSIFLLGLAFGYVAHRSKSIAAASLTHMLNNLFSA